MSRLRVNEDDKARADFRQEVRVKRAFHDLKQRELGDAMGLAPARTSALLANPDEISIGRLRAINDLLGLDPVVVLAIAGYTPKQLRKSPTLRQLMGVCGE